MAYEVPPLPYDYDALDRVIRDTRYDVNASGAVTQTLTTHYCYDLAHDLRRVQDDHESHEPPGRQHAVAAVPGAAE